MSYSDHPYNALLDSYGDIPTRDPQTPTSEAAAKLKVPAIAMLVLALLAFRSASGRWSY